MKTDTLCVTLDYTKNYSESCSDSDSDSESETLWGGPSSSSDTDSPSGRDVRSLLSGLYLVVIVPPFHFLDNLSMVLNVLGRWFALMHLLRNASQVQVVPDTDGPEIVGKTTQQASF
jgi:hypothetical protein